MYEIFNEEINLIQDEELKQLTIEMLQVIPQYFYDIPASSSGRYHPKFALGQGGLVRHTKAAIKIAHELLNLMQYSDIACFHDEIIIALMFHDSFKLGKEKGEHTLIEHPKLAADFVRNYRNNKQLQLIAILIESHMGQWNSDVLPLPVTKTQQFVHLCDFISSMQYITVQLENTISVEEYKKKFEDGSLTIAELGKIDLSKEKNNE